MKTHLDTISGCEFVYYRDKHNTSRKMFLYNCKCGSSQWLAVRPKYNNCNKCSVKILSTETKEKISVALKKKYQDPIYKSRILAAANHKSGKDHWNWQGGTSTEREKLMKTDEYKNWRNSIFKRDNYQCRMCSKGGNVHAHHIIPYSVDKSKALNIDNGITLCIEHHTLIHKYYREVSN